MVTGFGQACVEFYPHLVTEPGTDGAPTAAVSTRYTLKNKDLNSGTSELIVWFRMFDGVIILYF